MAVRAAGWCLVGIGLIVVLARRLIGDAVVNSLVTVPSNKPAVHQAFAIGTSLLYNAAIALITYGALLVVAAWIAGPTRPACTLAAQWRPRCASAWSTRAPRRPHALLVVIWSTS